MQDLDTQSIRAQIIQAIAERAQNILVMLPGGREADPDVLWARSRLKPEELPAIVVTPEPDTPGDEAYGADLLTIPITISAACLLGKNHPVDLGEFILAQMRKAIPGNDTTIGGLAETIRYAGGGVEEYPDRNDQAMVVVVTFEIDYETATNNPDEGV